ncbi:hypothetical protein [Nocardia macrotermitis]|uniref:hypothetical protein n=1 Tax=Nocardia macrotermitis TaxID=2585198 RepID=UPI001296A7ED|nr:hypothetical protein [Nocardia macrotermitis]
MNQPWHESRLRSLAGRFGFEYSKTIVFTRTDPDRMSRLLHEANRAEAEAIFTPTLAHLDYPDLDTLLVEAAHLRIHSIITWNPMFTYQLDNREPRPHNLRRIIRRR